MEPNRAEELRLAEQAAEWLARLPAADLEQRRAFIEWLKLSPLHVAEVLHAVRVNRLLDRHAQALWNATNERSFDPASDLDGLLASPVTTATRAKPTTRRSVGFWRITTCVVALMLVVLLTALVRSLDDTIHSGSGEWRTTRLQDGSTVTLGPRSHLQVDFDDRTRSVQLTEGSASFDVASDGARPFIVKADCCNVRARGTRFTVSLRERGMLVTVADGSVVVSQVSPARAVTVAAREQLRVTGGETWAPQPVDTTAALAWVNRRLIFKHQTIAEALQEFNRLNELQLKLDDESIAKRPVRGSFAADDPRAFAYMLERTEGVVVVDDDRVLRLVPNRTSRGAAQARSGDDER